MSQPVYRNRKAKPGRYKNGGSRERVRQWNLKKKFDITPAQYDLLFKLQDGLCAICRQSETVSRGGMIQRLTVDHDHKTDEIRGLLCQACNMALGFVRDNPTTARALATYLEADHALVKLVQELV